MPTFPRVGTELSSSACVTFGKPRTSNAAVYQRPGFLVTFENEWEETRTNGDAWRFKQIPVHFLVNQTDFNVIVDFLKARDFFNEPFTLEHPYLGTGTVRYYGSNGGPPTEFAPDLVVAGNPAWYEFEILFKGQF